MKADSTTAGTRTSGPMPLRKEGFMSDVPLGRPSSLDGPGGETRQIQQAKSGQPVRAFGPRKDESSGPFPGFERFEQFDRLELESLMLNAYAQFVVEPKTRMVSIKIIDATTEEVIREIPPDVVLRYAEELESYLGARQRSGI